MTSVKKVRIKDESVVVRKLNCGTEKGKHKS